MLGVFGRSCKDAISQKTAIGLWSRCVVNSDELRSIDACLLPDCIHFRNGAILQQKAWKRQPKPNPSAEHRISPLDKIVHRYNRFMADRWYPFSQKMRYAKKTIKYHNNLNSEAIATVFDCCCKGRFIHQHLFNILSMRLCSPDFLYKCRPGVISLIIQSSGTLARKNREKMMLKGEKADEMSRTFFHRLGPMTEALTNLSLEREQHSDRIFDEREAVEMLSGLGWIHETHAGIDPNQNVFDLFEVLIFKLCKRGWMMNLTTEEIAKVVMACGNVQYFISQPMTALCNELQLRLERDQRDILRRVRNATSKGMDRRLQSRRAIMGKDIAHLVFALGNMNFAHLALLETLICEIIDQEGMLTHAADIHKVLVGLAELDYHNDQVVPMLAGRIGNPDTLSFFSDRQLNDLLDALVRLRHEDPQVTNVIKEELDRPRRQMKNMKERDLLSVLDSFQWIDHGGRPQFESGRYVRDVQKVQKVQKVQRHIADSEVNYAEDAYH